MHAVHITLHARSSALLFGLCFHSAVGICLTHSRIEAQLEANIALLQDRKAGQSCASKFEVRTLVCACACAAMCSSKLWCVLFDLLFPVAFPGLLYAGLAVLLHGEQRISPASSSLPSMSFVWV
jgi:hypothetical protein